MAKTAVKDENKKKTAGKAVDNKKKEEKKSSKNDRSVETKGKRSQKAEDREPLPMQERIHIPPNPESPLHKILPYVFIVFAVILFIFLAFASGTGVIGKALSKVLFGLFGAGSWAMPFVLLGIGLLWRRTVREDRIAGTFIYAFFLFFFLSVLLHVFFSLADPTLETSDMKYLITKGASSVGGGAVGGIVAFLLLAAIGPAPTIILLIVFTVAFVLLFLSLTVKDLFIIISYNIKVQKEKNAKRRQMRDEEIAHIREEEAKIAEREAEAAAIAAREAEIEAEKAEIAAKEKKNERKFDPDLYDDDEDGAIEAEPSLPVEDIPDEYADARIKFLGDTAVIEEIKPEKQKKGLPDLEAIFGEDAPAASDTELSVFDDDDGEETLDIAREPLEEAIPIERPKYTPPPIDMLKEPVPYNDENITAELKQKARAIVKTLESFHVDINISGYSRGPTVTRYEVVPGEGTSVKSIVNRVDDIALNLAANGVRIEAPIPGKAALGIEVPNKNRSTVYLRELIENEAFKNGKMLTAALGIDVGGQPVYCTIDDMPHLLIAGATGMGKSVCINSILISLLYRCTPDDLRLILVDPKRVEFKMYNDIPHLLVPVVTEPEKAAGVLSWAINEMERRFGLIEGESCRNITGYNEATKDDPAKEHLPYIMIVIDELADLMLTAKDMVEKSINRLAAKGRASGIHIVVGTQRPSVDVITGLIKANITSRIACTVASQVDSKTILDVGGAEKLLGSGDMLYSPIKQLKPSRVQGAFVSDGEVKRVTDYARSVVGGVVEYNEEVIAGIESEAAKCKSAKSSSGGGDEDFDGAGEKLDEKFREALEVAVENDKIATSLLQVQLSIGYGRAARIIATMEKMGFVGPADGTKPRKVLITKQQFRELVVNGEI